MPEVKKLKEQMMMMMMIYLTSITVTQAQLDKSVKIAKHYMSTTIKNVQNNIQNNE
jgi:hypothetical protein